ncbi:hypothetical protein UlMin_013667 [Ulmus minor]
MTFMSDKQKGLVEAIGELWEHCEHRFCVRHMYANFKKKFKNDIIRNKVWQAARSSKVEDFVEVMEQIRRIDERAWHWLTEKPATQWSRSHFRTYPKCDMLLNNLCEGFNGDRTIIAARSMPIYTMLEMIRVKIINRRASKRLECETWFSEIGPRIVEIMEVNARGSGDFDVCWGGDSSYEIFKHRQPITTVDLTSMTCSCRRWDLIGIPCMHAISAIYSIYEDPVKYVDGGYAKTTQRRIWKDVIHGIKNERYWTKTNQPPLLPPKQVKQIRRPKKLRIKPASEIPADARKFTRGHRKYTCTKCKKQGHSFRTCEKRANLAVKIRKKHNLFYQKKKKKDKHNLRINWNICYLKNLGEGSCS